MLIVFQWLEKRLEESNLEVGTGKLRHYVVSMSISEKLLKIYFFLHAEYPSQKCPLLFDSPLQLLIAAILSAQCRDKRVNMVTEKLFVLFPDIEAVASAKQRDFEEIIRPAGLYRNKSANIIATCKKIIREFDGVVPADMENLTTLPGVGRKTANVLLGNAFGIPGFPVDTHVKRVLSKVLGLSDRKSPEQIESLVNKNVPDRYWVEFSHLLISHGRVCCKARKTDCPNCVLSKICNQYR